jgi:hypothetical protein
MSSAPATLLEGRFELVRELGSGGMGEVWEAQGHELDSRVARSGRRGRRGLHVAGARARWGELVAGWPAGRTRF